MTQRATTGPGLRLPALIGSADPATRTRYVEFFTVAIRNAHPRRAYARVCGALLEWCARALARQDNKLRRQAFAPRL